jgi:hypothetical protein
MIKEYWKRNPFIRNSTHLYESQLMENNEISDETISERIKMILERKERELTYRKKTNELIKKLKLFYNYS